MLGLARFGKGGERVVSTAEPSAKNKQTQMAKVIMNLGDAFD